LLPIDLLHKKCFSVLKVSEKNVQNNNRKAYESLHLVAKGKYMDIYRAGRMAQVVEHLPRKHKYKLQY
jgi:hypothetical protein